MLNSSLFNEKVFNIVVPPSHCHYLFDGSYRTAAGIINHVVVVAKNGDGDFIMGEDRESGELAAVGERLDFRLVPQAGTESDAEAIAGAVLDRERLNSLTGFITLPPNCGVQLFDVVSIAEDMSTGDSMDLRVIGIELTFNAVTGQYFQKLVLGSR